MLKMLKNKVLGSTVALCALLIVTTLLLLVSSSFAYFKAIIDTQGVNSMMIELIFDRLDDEGFAAYKAKYNTAENPFEPTPEATWGTKENPYVISQKYHVQNLSVLQNAGFFEKRLDANGDPIQAHFLVCNPDGSVVAINCGGMKIAPIGTHELPFTGVVLGAPQEGTSSYTNAAGQSYGTSLSAIANLTVETTLGEPDIGFFGRLGYFGEKTTGEDDFGNETVTVNGYAADVEDLLLADVTIRSRYSLLDNIANWWAGLTGHLNNSADRAESHHVGIVAGHAEFATVKNVSVYYSENVVTFDLVGNVSGSNTNYYSTTGLIGLLDCVNPVVGTDGVLDGSDAVSDDVLVGDGTSGGGGDESGTMTGYFLAKNLFDRHEATLSASELKDSYNVSEMKTYEGDEIVDLFKTVTMAERKTIGWNNWEYRNYFYFQDTVFTFAMSMSVAADQNGNATETPTSDKSDFVQKIWKDITNETRPSISTGKELDDLQYGPDPNATPPISYHLTAVETPTNNRYYIIAYHNKEDNCLYLIDLNDNTGARGYTKKISLDDADQVLGVTKNGTDITSIDLKGISQTYYDYTIQYVVSSDGTATIKRPSDATKYGVTASGNYENPTTTISQAENTGGNYDGDTAFVHYWSFTKDSDSNRYRITGESRLGGTTWLIFNNYRYIFSVLEFDNESSTIGFNSYVSDNQNNRNNYRDNFTYEEDIHYFTLFEVKANTFDDAGNITNEAETGNKLLAPKDIFPNEDYYNFDPSTHVLQFVEGEKGTADDSYKLVPIRALKLNDGQGNLLEEINHITRLYQTTNANTQWTIGNLFSGNFGNLISNLINTNSGGVLNTTIGTSNTEVYSIPTGMIAFEINEASEEKPSYINIIVAIEPDQEAVGTVGLWRMNKRSWTQGFDITNPMDKFNLPVSTTAKSAADIEFAIKISERIVEEDDNGKKIYNVKKTTDSNGNEVNETSYLYLGGDVALVYYTFKITDIEEESVFMLGSMDGPLSVAYFSVTGAAGKGNDGMSGSPLGNVDFVYDFGGNIITTDKHYVGDAPLINLEEYENYYPSYLFVGMLPEKDQEGNITKIQNEVIKIRRYIAGNTDTTGTKRHLQMLDEILTKIRPASPVMEDYQDDID